MTRILVTGLKEPAGGVENVVLSYLQGFDPAQITADFAFIGEKVSFEEKITSRGGEVIYLPNRVRDPKGYKAKLDEIFAEHHYDAVWCNFSGLTNIDFLKTAKKARVAKRIAHAHTSGYFWGNRIMKYLVPIFHNKNKCVVAKYATDFWACSQKAAVFMFGAWLAAETKMIFNAIRTADFKKNDAVRAEMRAEFGLGEGVLTVGHVGRMCTAKNQFFLLDIMKELLKQRADAKLLFVGDGELRDAVVDYANEIGIKEAVLFTGSRSDVPKLLQAFDLFLLPSTSEGLPVVLIEAQAADVPCVTSEKAVTDQVNVTGDVTFVSLELDAYVWAQRVLDAAAKPLADGAEKLAAAGYDISAEAKKMQDFFVGSN